MTSVSHPPCTINTSPSLAGNVPSSSGLLGIHAPSGGTTFPLLGASCVPSAALGASYTPPKAALDTTTKFVAAGDDGGELTELRRSYLRLRYAAQRTAAKALPNHRVESCMVQSTGGAVSLLYHPKHGRSSYAGLMTCGSVWVCPICAPRIAERRAEEIGRGVGQWREVEGGAVAMLTLTTRHGVDDRLRLTKGRLNAALRSLNGKRAYKGWMKRLGSIGYIAANEATYGVSGWHPHVHRLLFVRHPEHLNDFFAWLLPQWSMVVAKHGGSALAVGQDLREVTDRGVGRYLTKSGNAWHIGAELAKPHAKAGRGESQTSWQLLAGAQRGDADAIRLFQEYAEAMHGLSSVRWSPGLREALGIEAEQPTDEEIAAEETAAGEVLVIMPPTAWREVVRAGRRVDLLIVGESGSTELVSAFLFGLGIDLAECRFDARDGPEPQTGAYPAVGYE